METDFEKTVAKNAETFNKLAKDSWFSPSSPVIAREEKKKNEEAQPTDPKLLEFFASAMEMKDEKTFFAYTAAHKEEWEKLFHHIEDMTHDGAEACGADDYLTLLRFMGHVARFAERHVTTWLGLPQPRWRETNRLSAEVCLRYATEVLKPECLDDGSIPPMGKNRDDERVIQFMHDILYECDLNARVCAALVINAANIKHRYKYTYSSGAYPTLNRLPEAEMPAFFAALKKWAAIAIPGAVIADYVAPAAADEPPSESAEWARESAIKKQVMNAYNVINAALEEKIAQPAAKKQRIA
jgi:hypothetical protein